MMAEASELNKYRKDQLTEMAGRYGVTLDGNENKDTLVEKLSGLSTEQVTEYNATLPTSNDEQSAPHVDPADPATSVPSTSTVVPPVAPEDNDPATTPEKKPAKNLEVGSSVYYPYEEADGGYRLGYVQQLDGDIVTVNWVDGSDRQFSADVLKEV